MTKPDGPPLDDLTRILTYADAIDGRVGVTELGAELLVLPFWTPSFCAAIVRAAELVGVPPSVYRRQAAEQTLQPAPGMPSCLEKAVTRPIRNREAPAADPRLA